MSTRTVGNTQMKDLIYNYIKMVGKNMSEVTYTQEQMDIAIIKNEQGMISKTLDRIDSRLDRLESKLDSNFHWTLIFGMYAMGLTGLTAALCHAYGWF
jgi:hypothetical protein